MDEPLTVLVTGANRGIGLGLATSYAHDGHRVIATVRDLEDCAELDALARTHDVTVMPLDLADPASIDALAAQLSGTPVDVLLNNAGTMGPLPLEDHIHRQKLGSLDYELWASILATNTLGTVHLTEALTESVAASRRRTIVMVSSTAGSIAESDRAAIAYTSSKAALNKASTIIARALAPRGVIVLVVCPGHVVTRLGIGGATIEIADSVAGLRRLVDAATMADSGTFRRYNGEVIGW